MHKLTLQEIQKLPIQEKVYIECKFDSNDYLRELNYKGSAKIMFKDLHVMKFCFLETNKYLKEYLNWSNNMLNEKCNDLIINIWFRTQNFNHIKVYNSINKYEFINNQ